MRKERQLPRLAKDFGQGHFIGQTFKLDVFSKSELEQALWLGWQSGCPIPQEVIGNYGVEFAVRRYSETNFWHNYIVRLAEHYGLGIKELRSFQLRPASEPPKKFERNSVTLSHAKGMDPMVTLPGYALSRVLIEQFGRKDEGLERNQERLIKGLQILDDVIAKAQTADELLAMLAGAVTETDADPVAVLSHVFSQGWLDEENSPTSLKRAALQMKRLSPKLWQSYLELSDEERRKNDIAEVIV